jgi:hypothetical protein
MACRLFALEKKSGNEAAAQAALINLRFWTLKNLELEHKDVDEAMRILGEVTTEDIFAQVDKFDKGATEGKGPGYLKSIVSPKPSRP